MKSFLPNIPFFTVHLKRETLREAFMTHLQNSLGRRIHVWDASDGAEVASRGWPRGHPFEAETSIGALGCLDSHIRLLQHMLTENYPIMGVFEDDAECVSDISYLESYYESVNKLDPNWDILFLGANEWVECDVVQSNVIKVRRFWGTHAFLIRESAARKVIQDHRNLLAKGYAYPADWLYAYSIQMHHLKAYGPVLSKKHIRQKPGLISAINGKLRI
jgi:GR25 family glycosyltransferase involved in LPS biosynthesis